MDPGSTSLRKITPTPPEVGAFNVYPSNSFHVEIAEETIQPVLVGRVLREIDTESEVFVQGFAINEDEVEISEGIKERNVSFCVEKDIRRKFLYCSAICIMLLTLTTSLATRPSSNSNVEEESTKFKSPTKNISSPYQSASNSTKINTELKIQSSAPTLEPTSVANRIKSISAVIMAISNTSQPSQEMALQFIIYDDLQKLSASSINLFQRYALMVIFYSMNGENWNEIGGFGTGSVECEWKGVDCFANGTLNILDLSSNGVIGSIPSEIALLHSLEVFNLTDNQISGPIPEEMRRMKSLNSLILTKNALRGSVSETIMEIESLEKLHLDHNQLSGSFPTKLGFLPTLKSIHIGHNNLNGTLPDFTGYPEIRVLLLEHNEFTGTIPSSIQNLSKLNSLWLYNNGFTGTVPTEIGLLKGLYQLLLHENGLVGSILQGSEICLLPLGIFMLDCRGSPAEITCDCCTVCCATFMTNECGD